MKITWKKDIRQYSNGEWGYRGRIRLFWIGYSVTLKEHRETPYILRHSLPGMTEGRRFDTIEAGKAMTEEIFNMFMEEMNKKGKVK